MIVAAFVSTAQAQYRFDSWTTDKGLPQNSVYSILQTRDGYIWFTTLDGFVRFDGVRFTVFNKSNAKNLPTSRFIDLFAEDDGTLWVSTEDSGLVRYRDGEFRTFTVADGLPSNRVFGVQKDTDGSLLISTDAALMRFTRDNRFHIERQMRLQDYKVYIAPSGARWELDAGGLRRIKDGATTHYDLPFDPNHINADRTFNYFAFVPMLEDESGALWFVAEGSLFKLTDAGVTVLTSRDGVPGSPVYSLLRDRQGSLWLATEKDGACRLADNHFTCYTTKDGLSSNHIRDMLLDREGTLWFATNDGGINRLTRQVVQPLSVAAGLLDKNVYPILEGSRGNFWIGSFSALANYENGRFKNYTREDGLLYEIVQSLYEDRDGRLWIGSIGGVEYFENGKFYDFTKALNAQIGELDCWDIHRDRHGALWLATNKGVIRYDGETTTRLTTDDGLPGNDVKVILEARDGTLWFGAHGGLAKLNAEQRATPIAVADGQGSRASQIRALYVDEAGTLWIGTYDEGLWRLKDGRFTRYTIENGLFSNGVFQILEDGRGNFWMSSNQGIYRVSREQLNDYADGKRQVIISAAFGKSDGMLNIECNGGRQPAGIKTTDGKLWFPTQDGVAVIDPEAVPFNPLPPPVVIESIRIGNSLLKPSGQSNENSAFRIKPNQNNFEIAYTGLSFIKPEQIRFRYKLEGLDTDWTEAGARRTAYFAYLPPGTYTFRVVAANSDNVWNEEGAALEIVVLPPFYRTSWFIGLTIFGLAAIGFALYKWRVSALERRHRAQEEFSRRLINAHETERRRIAAELHDSIGQSLAMIKNRAVFGSQSVTDAAAREYLETITAQTAQTIGEVREISYNLRPYLLERLGLTKAIKSLVNKISETHHLKISADIDDVDRQFESEAEMSVYRIVQESLNNVVKHADATEVKVLIKRDRRILTMTIEDDGRGFARNAPRPDGDAARGGFGLLGLVERVRMLGGSQTIESAIGKGTRITVKIPLRHAGAENADGKRN